LGKYAGWALLMSAGTAVLPPTGFVFLLAMFGSFLCFLNLSTALAADEIRVQKKRVVSDVLIAKMV
jgi:hypothetical protein